jgi:hypothetical protein
MIINRIKSAALITCAIMGASISLAATAQAASSSATASQRPVASAARSGCAYASANLHFNYWGPAAHGNLVWSSRGSASGNGVLIGNKSTSSSLDCFKALGFGGGAFEFQQYQSSLCLNVAGNSRSAGAWIILYPCISTSDEKLTLNFFNNQTQLQSVSSGLCVDMANGFQIFSQLVQKSCQSRSDIYQEWTFATS